MRSGLRAIFLSFVLSTGFATTAGAQDVVTILTDKPITVYCLGKNSWRLKEVQTLPPQSTIAFVPPIRTSLYDFEDGRRETGGFYSRLSIAGVELPNSCSTEEGWIVSMIDIDAGPYKGIAKPIQEEVQGDSRYLAYYYESGRPRPSRMRSFIDKVSKRFSLSWNKRIEFERINNHPESAFDHLSQEELKKWNAIYRELVAFADRTREFDLKYLYIGNDVRENDLKEAKEWSIRGEKNYGVSAKFGAWDIAVIGTAQRKGFGSTPCAEFASEVIRQAYTRAGYDFTEDFKPGLHTQLVVTFDKRTWGPQSVRGLGERLAKGGWIPWDPTRYKPMTGAIGMHGEATTPGHAYIIGGADGRIIVDNGHPLGLDLRGTSKRHKTNFIPRQYSHSVFWLPPGILPEAWESEDESLVIKE